MTGFYILLVLKFKSIILLESIAAKITRERKSVLKVLANLTFELKFKNAEVHLNFLSAGLCKRDTEKRRSSWKGSAREEN